MMRPLPSARIAYATAAATRLSPTLTDRARDPSDLLELLRLYRKLRQVLQRMTGTLID